VQRIRRVHKGGSNMTEIEISKLIVEAVLKVHKTLEPGLLESSYEECMLYELKK
jgi:hypothetical protein